MVNELCNLACVSYSISTDRLTWRASRYRTQIPCPGNAVALH
jgi:hypothetical protein